MSAAYCVVVFSADNSIEAVPSTWIRKREGTCAWPTSKNRNLILKLIDRKSIPNDIQYKYYEAKILKTCGNYCTNKYFS